VKTKLVNVRLDEEHLRKVRALRERGVALSDVVRDAIDATYDEVAAPARATNAAELIAQIHAEHPDPPDLAPREYDVHDAASARAAILARLKRNRG
jgi:Arc/MetJ-type ribon-helix-helix transcriptional regulator